MSDQPFYVCIVRDFRGTQLLHIVGERATVIEAALRVILDHAPALTPDAPYPAFTIDARQIKA